MYRAFIEWSDGDTSVLDTYETDLLAALKEIRRYLKHHPCRWVGIESIKVSL